MVPQFKSEKRSTNLLTAVLIPAGPEEVSDPLFLMDSQSRVKDMQNRSLQLGTGEAMHTSHRLQWTKRSRLLVIGETHRFTIPDSGDLLV